LDYIVNWVDNPKSKHALILLSQAGMGKSLIAHETACRFENNRLGSYITFLQKEQSKDEAYKLFTTLACNLSDQYPVFKLTLGRVIKGNSSLHGTKTIIHFLNTSLNRSRTCSLVIQFLSALMDWMRVETQWAKGDCTHPSPNISSTCHQNSTYSSPQGRMVSDLHSPMHCPSTPSTWMMPN
jgi:hypothetical protein